MAAIKLQISAIMINRGLGVKFHRPGISLISFSLTVLGFLLNIIARLLAFQQIPQKLLFYRDRVHYF